MNEQDKLDKRLCFCGSGDPFDQCCQPVISGQRAAQSAEQLMRSRYSAYVLEDADYLLRSWHPDTRPASLGVTASGLSGSGLTVCARHQGEPGDLHGRVEFIARYQQQGKTGAVHEISRFVFEQGQWLYVDGDLQRSSKVGRNDPCPCGSGKKYKKCCG